MSAKSVQYAGCRQRFHGMAIDTAAKYYELPVTPYIGDSIRGLSRGGSAGAPSRQPIVLGMNAGNSASQPKCNDASRPRNRSGERRYGGWRMRQSKIGHPRGPQGHAPTTLRTPKIAPTLACSAALSFQTSPPCFYNRPDTRLKIYLDSKSRTLLMRNSIFQNTVILIKF